MDKYVVKLLPKAYRDIDEIYGYISNNLETSNIAENIVSLIETAIFSLDEFPYRGSERKVGIYANRGYRQLFIQDFTIIYRVDENKNNVLIVTVKYTPSQL